MLFLAILVTLGRHIFGREFGIVLGSFLAPFLMILDSFLEHFLYNSGGVFYKKRGFTCMGAHFSKVSLYFVVSLLLVGISEIAVLPAWKLNFREFA